MDANAPYVIVGYVLTAIAIGGYVLRLRSRARAARRRADDIAARWRSSEEPAPPKASRSF